MKRKSISFANRFYSVLLVTALLSGFCKTRHGRQRANPLREASLDQPHPHQASALLMVEQGVHYYPSSLFYKQYRIKKGASKEFKLIQKTFKSEDSTINRSRYEKFLRRYLVRNMFEDDEAPVTGLHELLSRYRVKLLVSGYLSGASRSNFSLEDCYTDLYIGRLFDWLLKQSEDL